MAMQMKDNIIPPINIHTTLTAWNFKNGYPFVNTMDTIFLDKSIYIKIVVNTEFYRFQHNIYIGKKFL